MGAEDQQTTDPSKLPGMLRMFFWDYAFETLTWEHDRDLISARVLAYGSWDAVTWLRSRLGDAPLREWIECRQGRGLSPQQLRFWELILELSHEQVNAWLQSEARKVWDERVRT